MFEKFSRSWSLVKASAAVLRADKELLLFPILSGVAALLVVGDLHRADVRPAPVRKRRRRGRARSGDSCSTCASTSSSSSSTPRWWARRSSGSRAATRPSADGFNAAKARIVPILGYAAIAATVGMLLQAHEEQGQQLPGADASAAAWAWPGPCRRSWWCRCWCNADVGPIDAIKQSVALLKRTWGENAIGNVGLGAVFGLIMFGTIALGVLLVIAAGSVSVALAITIGVLAVLAVVALGVVQSALSGIYSAALYRYATAGEAPAAFGSTGLQNAFAPK